MHLHASPNFMMPLQFSPTLMKLQHKNMTLQKAVQSTSTATNTFGYSWSVKSMIS